MGWVVLCWAGGYLGWAGSVWQNLLVSISIATVNVNGIRAAVRKGMLDWIEDYAPQVITLQEVRAPDNLLSGLLGQGWFIAHDECSAKGRAGVAIISRQPLRSVSAQLGGSAYNDSGRWIEATVDTAEGTAVTVISAYVHTGDADDAGRMEEKLAFLRDGIIRLTELRAAGNHVLFTGDLNVAHHEVDIKNWRGNIGRAGFHPDERAYLDQLIYQLGWVDLGRRLGGDGPGPYTWWSYRGQAFDNDAGWRIDYQIATPELAELASSATVHRSATYDGRWSDHAPLSVEFDL